MVHTEIQLVQCYSRNKIDCLKLPKSSQSKHQAKTNLKGRVVINRRPQIDAPEATLQPFDRDDIVASSCRVLCLLALHSTTHSLHAGNLLTCTTTTPTPTTKTNIFENALTSTPRPKPTILPKLICLIAAGFRVRPPSLLMGTLASRPCEKVDADVEKSAIGEESWCVFE